MNRNSLDPVTKMNRMAGAAKVGRTCVKKVKALMFNKKFWRHDNVGAEQNVMFTSKES